MSVQKYETDVLQEHIDSTPILIERLEQWNKGVRVVQEYVHGYVQVHQGISHHLEKTLRNIGDVPAFPEMTSEGQKPSPSSLSTVFQNLQTNTNVLLQRSVATSNGIRNTILPQLDQIVDEIDKHYKTLRSQGGKGIKEIEKSREYTQRMIEHLGRVSSSFGSRALSHNDDPFILHRRVEAAVAEQVGRENTQAEAALNVQKSFASLEGHIMQTVRHSLANLASLNDSYANSEREINDATTGLFKNVDLDREWNVFMKTNSQSLVPTTNFQRDPARVTFVNKYHPSTRPIISGVLSRRSTVLKNWNQSYYALAPSGYLHQLKSADAQSEPSPELSLYLPDCQLSRSSKPGESVFKIVGKESQKKIGGRSKYVFKANTSRELDAWYLAIARITGNIADDDIDSPADGDGDVLGSMPPTAGRQQPRAQPQSPAEPPTAAFANTTLDERVAPSSPNAAPDVTSRQQTAIPSPRYESQVPLNHQPSSPQQPLPQSGPSQAIPSQSGPPQYQSPQPAHYQSPPHQQGPQQGLQQGPLKKVAPPTETYQSVPVQQASSHTVAPSGQVNTHPASSTQASPSQQVRDTFHGFDSYTEQAEQQHMDSHKSHPWSKEIDEFADAQSRNSFLSENDPFKSF